MIKFAGCIFSGILNFFQVLTGCFFDYIFETRFEINIYYNILSQRIRDKRLFHYLICSLLDFNRQKILFNDNE